MRRILVLRGGALGDFIVTLPALAALRQRWPAAQLELAGNATAASLAKNRGILDAVHSQHESRWATLFSDLPLAPEFAAWLAGFDLILSYWPDPDGELRGRFPCRPGQVFLSAPAHPQRAPAAAHYATVLNEIGLATPPAFFSLAPLAPAAADVSGPPEFLVHPGSGSPRKNWPLDRWRTLIAQLPAPVTAILGEAEAGEPASAFAAANVDVLRSPPLEALVARCARARGFLGHDSGVSHLAAAAGARCILLFGPTDPAVWAPPTPGVTVLRRGDTLESIDVAHVLAAVRRTF